MNSRWRTCIPSGSGRFSTAGGMTLMEVNTEGKRKSAKAVVYACGRPEVVQHEAVHAYCHQTFGRIGPVWYSEGMAEMGHYWSRRRPRRPRRSARDRVSPRSTRPSRLPSRSRCRRPAAMAGRITPRAGPCAISWSITPTTRSSSRRWGGDSWRARTSASSKTYGAVTRQLFFEYLLFLQHISPGYRVDLCAWDWKKKSASLQPGTNGDRHGSGGPRMAARRPQHSVGSAIASTLPQAPGNVAGDVQGRRMPTATSGAAAGWWGL